MRLSDTLSPFFEALAFAADQHKYQRRGGYDRLPYINHLLKVTQALLVIGKEENKDIIVACILHDIVEDTEVTIADLTEKFGAYAANIVAELTDDMAQTYEQRKQLQVEKASQLSIPARKIRIADKASNIQDIFTYPLDWSADKKKNYVENAILIVDQIRDTNQALEQWFDETIKFARQKMY